MVIDEKKLTSHILLIMKKTTIFLNGKNKILD